MKKNENKKEIITGNVHLLQARFTIRTQGKDDSIQFQIHYERLDDFNPHPIKQSHGYIKRGNFQEAYLSLNHAISKM